MQPVLSKMQRNSYRVTVSLQVIPHVHSTASVHVHFLTTSTKESDAWLYALPMSYLGHHMDDEVAKLAMFFSGCILLPDP